MTKLRDTRAGRWLAAGWNRLPAGIRQSRLWVATLALIAANFLYWAVIASNRYVSEAHVLVGSTDMQASQTFDLSSMLSGAMGGDRDTRLLRDFLLSTDMAERMDTELHLREHWSDWRRDPLSRMLFAHGPREWYYAHYRSRVYAEVDDVTGVLNVRVQAYTPEMSQMLARALVREGERFINEMEHSLAREQVAFLESEVLRMGQRLQEARSAMLAYQDSKGYVSPDAAVQGISSIVNSLESDLAKLRAQRDSLRGYLSAQAPDVVRLDLQIAGLERQLAREKGRLASPQGKALNAVAEEYQRLQLEAEFALDVYKSAIVALEKGRLDATRKLKKVSVVQSPQLADEALEPSRLYNIFMYTLGILLVAGIGRLLSVIVQDHKD